MLHNSLCFSSLSLLGVIVPFVRSDNRFLRPPNTDGNDIEKVNNNQRFQVGELIKIEWQTESEAVNVIIWQESPHNNGTVWSAAIERNVTFTQSFWEAEYDPGDALSGRLDSMFYLSLHDADAGDMITTSQYFNVTAPGVGASITETSISATKSAPTTLSSSAFLSDATFNPTTSQTEGSSETTHTAKNNGSGLSTGATAGIASGVSIAGVLMLGGFGLLLWKCYRQRKIGDKGTIGHITVNQNQDLPVNTREYKSELPASHLKQPAELDYSKQPSELE